MTRLYGENWLDCSTNEDFIDFNNALNSYLHFKLNTINELYEDWQEETGVTLVAVSIDDSKTKNNLPMYVNGKGWEYLVLMDSNGDLKRAMGVNNVPHTFLVNSEGEIVYSHNNYAPGDEDVLCDEILKISNK